MGYLAVVKAGYEVGIGEVFGLRNIGDFFPEPG